MTNPRTTSVRRARAAGLLMALVAAVTSVSVIGSAGAATISVSAGESIQAAIDAAAPGDTIEVGPGVYPELLDFGGKAVTVRSVGGPTVTTIDGQGAGAVVTFVNDETRLSVLEGFTIVNGSDTTRAGGIYAFQASPTIRGNVITENEGCTGSGLNIRFSAALIEDNEISYNHSRSGWSGCRGGGVAIGGAGAVELIGNTIIGNSADTAGGGIQLNAAGTPYLADNVVTNNSSRFGGGIEIINRSDVTLVQNLIVDNTATDEGGGISWLVPSGGQGPQLHNNTIAGNVAPLGQAIFADGFQDGAVLSGNILVGSTQAAVVCGDTYNNGVPTFDDNMIWSSLSADDFTGGCPNPIGANGNLAADPLFETGAHTLAAGSPAVDTGDPTAPLGATDLAGNPRVVDGTGDGNAVVDRGAYERQEAPVTVPSEPTDLTATRKKRNRAQVSWSPPADDGGSPVTGYVVTVVETGATVTTSGTSVTLSDISKNTAYTITVAASNAVGTGDAATVTLDSGDDGGPKCHPKKGC